MATTDETATYIGDLATSSTVPADSGSTGKRYKGGAEIRKTKDIMKATFPNVTGAVTATHTELNLLDGSTAGTAVASKALVVDANKDITLGAGDFTATNITGTGTVTIATADINGGAIDGVTIGASSAGAATFTTADINGGTIDGAALGTTVTAVTQSPGNNTTAVATTAFVTAAVAASSANVLQVVTGFSAVGSTTNTTIVSRISKTITKQSATSNLAAIAFDNAGGTGGTADNFNFLKLQRDSGGWGSTSESRVRMKDGDTFWSAVYSTAMTGAEYTGVGAGSVTIECGSYGQTTGAINHLMTGLVIVEYEP